MNSLVFAAALFASLSSANVSAATDVQTLSSGVVIEHIKKGEGSRPSARDEVTVHYRGQLDDGTEFDSSYKRGEPVSFPLTDVIPCWTEGVQKLAVGDKAKLTCPGSTAYGSEGIPGIIPPNATLNFEVELLSITAK